MRLCAVFLAIFLPAALVADGCFFLTPAAAAAVPGLGLEVDEEAEEAVFVLDAEEAAPESSLGFTWMILRVLVGGGGRTNWSFGGAGARLRDLTVSLACTGKACTENAGCEGLVAVDTVLVDAMAGGGSSNDIWSDAIFEPS